MVKFEFDVELGIKVTVLTFLLVFVALSILFVELFLVLVDFLAE